MSDTPIPPLRALADATPPPELRARLLAGPPPRPHPARTVATVFACSAAVACGAALIGFGLRLAAPAPPAPLLAGAVLRGEVPTAAGVHRIEPAAGASVVLEEDGPALTRLRLDGRAAHFSVAPLPPGRRLLVQAEALSVEVVGTRFVVERDGACTRVRVEEGRVRARAPGLDRFVSAGERAESCVSSALPGEALVREALTALSAGGDAVHAEALLLRYLEAQPAGDFEEEARFHLFALAAAARAPVAGERAAAFLARFPGADRAARVRAWVAMEAP